jgi:hypothetical protein
MSSFDCRQDSRSFTDTQRESPSYKSHGHVYTGGSGIGHIAEATIEVGHPDWGATDRPHVLHRRASLGVLFTHQRSQVDRGPKLARAGRGIGREVDARANNLVSALRRNPDWLEESLTNWDGILEAPLAIKLPRL